jgi:hypothetical protein
VTPFAVAICVGPEPAEFDRVSDLVESLRTYDAPRYFVMVDDAKELRGLEKQFDFPAECKAISVQHPKHRWPEKAARSRKGKGICSAVQASMQWIAQHAQDVKFVLKLDTDALVIAPFAEKIAKVFEANPAVGNIGAYDFTPNGDPRDISKNGATMEALSHNTSVTGWVKGMVMKDERFTIREHIHMALDHGYVFGEHCLGGAYALNIELLKRMLIYGYLSDESLWLPVDCPEDVMMGMYTKASGMQMKGYVGDDEVFGVRHKGLPDNLPRLVERGFSIIHSTKDYGHLTEAQIREFFKQRRDEVLSQAG